ncbi:MAG: S8 family serine peptidase, partial [Luteitalea sp.]
MTRATLELRAAILLIAALVVTSGSQRGSLTAQPAGSVTESAAVAGEYLITYRDTAPRPRRDALLARISARLLRRLDAVRVDHVQLPRGLEIAATLRAAGEDPDVLGVQPNYVRHSVAAPPSNDPYWLNDALWALQRIGAQGAWADFTTGSDALVIANIDSGVNYLHPDLAANMWVHPSEIAGNRVDDDGNGYVDDVHGIDTVNRDSDPMDDQGHGTHTAGTAAASGNNGVGVTGVSWRSKILACKFLGADGSGTDAGAIECLNYITALKQRGVNIRISSNSWGGARGSGPFPGALQNAIDVAGSVGILNVFAAGNAGVDIDTTPFDPASFSSESIVSVAASGGDDSRASFSNYGPQSVDLAAPGVSILSTATSGGYAYASGTSVAAPHVAGAVALMLSRDAAMSIAQVKAALLDHTERLSQWTGLTATGGRLNVYRSLLLGSGNVPPAVSITTPVNGATFTAPATLQVSVSASDADGVVGRVDLYVDGALRGSASVAPYSFALSNVPRGVFGLTATAVDDRGAVTTSAAVAVNVQAATGGRVNVAAASAGASASASSIHSGGFSPDGVINGDRKGVSWGAGGGWNDATPNSFPDWLQIEFAGVKTISEVSVFSVQDAYTAPVEPTTTGTFSLYGVTSFAIQYWDGAQWTTVSGGTITGNQHVWRTVSFPAVTTTRVRVVISGAPDMYSRLTEVEAYESASDGPVAPGPVNVAAASTGASASASSTHSGGYSAAGAINGDRTGANWGAGGGWNDATPGSFPDWLQVDFAGAKTISEVAVFSVQDTYVAPAEPTLTQTFSRYGVTNFTVQYWDGAQWAAVAGGTISGNQNVWRTISFPAVTTTRIRVVVDGAPDMYSRLTEVEAYENVSPGSVPPAAPNVAASSAGASASASTAYSGDYSPAAAINGDRKGASWG